MKIINTLGRNILWFVVWLAFFSGVLVFFNIWLTVSFWVWIEQVAWSYNWLFIAAVVVMAVATPVLLKIGSKALKTEEKKSLVYLGLGAALLPVVFQSSYIYLWPLEWLVSAMELDSSYRLVITVWIVLIAVTAVASQVLFSIGSRALRTKEKVPLICLALGVALLCVMAAYFPRFLSAFYLVRDTV